MINEFTPKTTTVKPCPREGKMSREGLKIPVYGWTSWYRPRRTTTTANNGQSGTAAKRRQRTKQCLEVKLDPENTVQSKG
jgi:hypothetical protein